MHELEEEEEEEEEREHPYRHRKEHVAILVQLLEPTGIVRELVPVIRSARVAQEDALDLAREIGDHLRIGLHDVAIACIRHEDEFPLGESLEDLIEQVFADTEGGFHVAEIQRARVKRAAWVGFVDEVHVVAGDLFGGGGQVVEMEVGYRARPVGIDGGHVLPLHEGAGEGVEETFFGLVDLGNAQDVVDVGDDG